LCRRYTVPLTLVASVILGDEAAADEVVSDTIAAACRFGQPDSREVTHTQLARSLYHRCRGRLATYERFGSGRRRAGLDECRNGRASALRSLTVDQRAAVALVLFGAHDLARTATTLTLSPAAVTGHLQDALARLATSVAGPASD
jgi:DNA-directed RNA polymerase specialized sigma24 family protein